MTTRQARASAPTAGTIGVTGAAGALGRRVVAALAGGDGVDKIIGLDVARPDGADALTWRTADVRDPLLDQSLAGMHTLVHVAGHHHPDTPADERRAVNVRGTENLLAAAESAGVQRVVLVTSALVYGAHPDNPVPITEDAPLRATPDDTLIGDFLEVERLVEAHRARHAAPEVVVLRPASLVGPGADSVVTRHFESRRLLVVRGTSPLWQFCHIDDLAAACALAARGGISGSVNVACHGWLTQEQVEAVAGLRRLELPWSLAIATAERLHRAGLTPAPPSELQYLMHPWVVSAAAIAAAGWQPAYDNAVALREQVEITRGRVTVAARRLSREDATRAAAGATVALLGTAALVRRARKRRR